MFKDVAKTLTKTNKKNSFAKRHELSTLNYVNKTGVENCHTTKNINQFQIWNALTHIDFAEITEMNFQLSSL